jgi:hypothetical protein
MYYDDFIARQTIKANNPSPSHRAREQKTTRGLLPALWRGVRQIAWGIDAFSSVTHGVSVPPDHGARRRPCT